MNTLNNPMLKLWWLPTLLLVLMGAGALGVQWSHAYAGAIGKTAGVVVNDVPHLVDSFQAAQGGDGQQPRLRRLGDELRCAAGTGRDRARRRPVVTGTRRPMMTRPCRAVGGAVEDALLLQRAQRGIGQRDAQHAAGS